MQGCSSIKKVLPVLIPELSYDDLNIGEGGTASFTYAQLPNMDSETHAQKITDLLEYCKQDTWAMVRIWQWIGEQLWVLKSFTVADYFKFNKFIWKLIQAIVQYEPRKY